MKCYLSIALAVFILALPWLTLFSGCSAPSPDSEAKAAIIDQLTVLQPNQVFIDQVTADLEAYGLKVDVYQGKEVSVKFYRELPQYGYKLIIFRAHSGMMQQREGTPMGALEATYLLTGEAYTEMKYVREQLTYQVLAARVMVGCPLVFAINPIFLLNSMEGRFDNTAIIMMGCSCTYLNDMTHVFILKGASTYLGWDASVGLDYVDQATANLITNLCDKGMTIEQAVDRTMAEVGPDPDYGAYLKYYPTESGNKTITELIGKSNHGKLQR